jgi:transposase-like protein
MSDKKDTLTQGLLQVVQEEGTESLRSLLQIVCQAVREAEMTQCLVAERYERPPDRQRPRNGSQPRPLTTRVGTLQLRLSQDREGKFHTQLFERYQRSEKALLLTLPEMYLKGVPTRKVSEIAETLCETGFNGEINRRTQVVRIFPNEAACLRLVAALAMEQSEEWLAGARYLDMTVLGGWGEVRRQRG